MKKIKEILEGVYSSPELRSSIVPLFLGDPGLGKTFLIKQFAEEKGANLVEIITSQVNPFEVSGMPMPDKYGKIMSICDFDRLLQLKDGDIVFFDELLNGNPTVLNASLTLLESRVMISGKKLPDVMIVAAANPQGMCQLTPQIKERFVWYNVEFSAPMWKEYMKNKYFMPDSISNKLITLIQNESFDGNNFYTPRSIDKAVGMFSKGVYSPYDHVKTILDTLVKNPLSAKVEEKEGQFIIDVNETISWLKLIRQYNGITTE